MSSLLTPAQRALRRHTRRSVLRGAEWYLRLLEHRGRMTGAEARGFRLALDRYLTTPDFAAPADTAIEPVRVRHGDGQVRGEWVEAPGVGPRSDAVLLYVHGGGFVSGSTRSHRGLVAELSHRTGRPAFSLDYRLAPRYRFPAAADDVRRAWSWLLDGERDPTRVVVLGDSAGGHLALGLPPRAARAGLPVPAGVVAFSPVVDPHLPQSVERDTSGRHDPFVAAASAVAFMTDYHRHRPEDDHELALWRDDLSVLPPVLVQYGTREFLAADVEHYADAVRAAGGHCRTVAYDRQPHAFQVAFRLSRSADRALDEVAAFVHEVTAPS